VSGPGPDVSFLPAPGFFGQLSFTFRVFDGAAFSASAQVIIDVLPRNDAPTFLIVGASVVPEGTTTIVTEPAFATSMSAGPADESGQGLQFVITGNTNPALFTQGPQIDVATGDLTYQPTGVEGFSVITVVLVDDGGTTAGGTDTSLPQSFVIYVGDPPKPKRPQEEPSCSTGSSPGLPALVLLLGLTAALAVRRLTHD
jgi:MYXO-CTERM domain-containing protein